MRLVVGRSVCRIWVEFAVSRLRWGWNELPDPI